MTHDSVEGDPGGTTKEIAERLKALPYEVPADISPGAISTLRAAEEFAAGATPQEVEKQCWERFEQASPEEQQECFAAARQTRETLSGFGLLLIGRVLLLLVWLVS